MIVQIYIISAKLASLKTPQSKILHILKQLLQILKVTPCFLNILKLRLHILKLTKKPRVVDDAKLLLYLLHFLPRHPLLSIDA